MPKNIIIFSDGTGQAGGLKPDQNLSNIYKLFRAARPGPDSPIDPAEQVAFYDAGLGTETDEGKIPFRPVQKFRKIWSAATGTGISRNIADCYEAILKRYEPGDRVFLFGFSRGAYTARCVGGVMSLCGVPTHAADGSFLPRFGKSLRRIADEAVSQVYEHGSGSNKPERKEERLEKARRFREKYGSQNEDGKSNVVPYFIGVFDTVAALGAPGPRRLLMVLALVGFVGAMTAAVAGIVSLMPWFTFWPVFFAFALVIALVLLAGYVNTSVKTIKDFPKKGDFSWHIAAWRFRFYDNALNKRVRYARHALAIDETRKDFARVPWASLGEWPSRPNEPEWLQQIWFAGNHSDIGGSYPEDESRLSDITLQWMTEQATGLPQPLQIDRTKLNVFPNAGGMQHCEVQAVIESHAWAGRFLVEEPRKINVEAVLHPTVTTRFALPGVLHYGLRHEYRPINLAGHTKLGQFYGQAPERQPLLITLQDRKRSI